MLKEGSQFGKYRIERKLGSGGMGAVYRAVDTEKNRVVAIKVIHPHIAEIEQFIKRFHQEAMLLEKLAHPRVVRIYESGQIDGHHYIAMEYVTGKSLTALMREREEVAAGQPTVASEAAPPMPTFRPFPEPAVLRVLEQMARVLQEAHELGVIHRDIKPDNIIVTNTERWDIKLLDFGIAKDTRELHTMVSQTGQVIGTPAYMSPEQCEGKRLDIRSDIYSLGVTAYQLLAGRLPFPGPTTMAFMKQHLLEEPPPLRQVNPAVSDGVAAVVAKMLQKEPQKRYQTPQDLLEEINRIRRGEPARALLELSSSRRQTADVATTRPPDAVMPPAEQTPEAVSAESDELTVRRERVRPAPQKAPGAAPAAASRKRSAAPILVVLLLLIAGGGSAGYWFLTRKKPVKPQHSATPSAADKSAQQPKQPAVDFQKVLTEIRHALARRDIKSAESALQKPQNISGVPPDILKKAWFQIEIAKRVLELERLLGRKVLSRKLLSELFSARGWERFGGAEKVIEFLDAVIEGEGALSEGRLGEAEEAFERARLISNGVLVRDAIRRLREAQRRQVEAARKKRLRKYLALVKRGYALLEGNDLEGAKKAFEEAVRLMPLRQEARRGLKEVDKHAAELEQQLKRKLAHAKQLLKKGNWQKACMLAEEVARLATGALKAEAADVATNAQRFGKYSVYLAQAERFKRDGLFSEAFKTYRQALLVLETTEAKRSADFCKLAEAALESFRQKQWDEAAKRASWALSVEFHPKIARLAVVSAVRANHPEWFKLRRLAGFGGETVVAVDEQGRLACASAAGLVVLTGNGQRITRAPLAGRATAVAFRKNLVAAGFANGTVAVWRFNGSALQLLWKRKLHTGLVSAVAVSDDGLFVYSAGADKHLCRVDSAKGQKAQHTKASTGGLTALLVLEDGRVVVGDEKGALRVFNRSITRQLLAFRTAHSGAVKHLSSVGRDTVMSVGGDNIAKIWALDIKKGGTAYSVPDKRLYAVISFCGLLLVAQDKELEALMLTSKKNVFARVRRFTLPSPAVRLLADAPRMRVIVCCENGAIYEFVLEIPR